MTPIRVLLAEDHHVVRAAVATLLNREEDLCVVGEVGDRSELLSRAEALRPDIIIMDAHMPGRNVLLVTEDLRRELPAIPILIFSAYDRREYVVGLLRAGAAGYVLKDDAPETLARAARQVAGGAEYLSPRVVQTLLRSYHGGEERPLGRLTSRERHVLRLMAEGRKNDEIAATLCVTVQTIKNHISNIFRKLEVTTRVEAVLLALNEGLALGAVEEE
jgi:DNA-binding NarL/FixJ family response regulator